MDIQAKKRLLGYILVFATIANILTPGFPPFVGISEVKGTSAAATVSGSAVVVPTSTPMPKDNWKVKVKKASHPKELNRGSGFDVKGTLVSARKIKYVEAEIKNKDGKAIYKKKVKVNSKKFDLKKVDNALKFSKLNKGSYVYGVTVTDQKKNTKEVIDDNFSVKQPKWMVPIQNPRWGDKWHCHCWAHGGRHFGWDILGGGLSIHPSPGISISNTA